MNQALKKTLRARLKEHSKQISASEKKQQSDLIARQLQSLLANATGTWGGFIPLAEEPDVFPLPGDLPIQWAYPRMDGQTLKFYASAERETGPYNVQEPRAEDFKSRDDIQGFIVPGLGYDRQGHRLGRGAGFYDRYLQGYSGPAIGVCFDFQLVPSSDWAEVHDFQVHKVVTPSQVIACKEHSWK
ncbi:MAG: 5-formyltetrahydrofolate cyclo-ligase [Bdellovibrionota bacterium]